MSSIRVSIIIPVYNTAKYLEKCLASIVSQTLKDIEIICVDDGSTDNSVSILEEFAKQDKRIKIIVQNNQKQGAARNRGISSARGEYIAFVDSDDYVAEDFFEKLYTAANENNIDIATAGIIRKREKSQKYRLVYNESQIAKSIDDKLRLCTSIGGDYNWNVWNKIYKKDFLLTNKIWFDENVLFEDINFTIKAIYLSNSIIAVPDSYYYYCVRSDSVVKGKTSKEKRQNLLDAHAKFYAYCLKNNIKISSTNSYCTNIYFKIFNFPLFTSKITFEKEWMKKEYKLFNLITVLKTKALNSQVIYSYPVDIVYAWCDGNDDNFRKEKDSWIEKLNIQGIDSSCKCQWIDKDELKFSIRSIVKYAPWIRNIYIITNSQIPKWLVNYNKNLDYNLPQIRIVDVKEIMPKDSLPVFNSQAIETCLSKIEGLSEHFLYSCDDMFFNNPVDKSFFFDKEGRPIVRLQGKISKKTLKNSLYARTIVDAQEKVNAKIGVLIQASPHHCIDAYTKNIFNECISDFREDFERTTYQKFRAEDSVQRAIILYNALAKSKAQLRLTKKWGLFSRDSKCISLNSPKKLRYLNNKSIKLFCLNDDIKATEEKRKIFENFLEQKFSNKSIYEEN